MAIVKDGSASVLVMHQGKVCKEQREAKGDKKREVLTGSHQSPLTPSQQLVS